MLFRVKYKLVKESIQDNSDPFHTLGHSMVSIIGLVTI